jgi:hypothetical protein
VYRINLLESEGNFSWEIIDKGKRVGPFSIPLEHFRANVYLKTEEVQQPGKPPEQKKRVAGIVFFNTPENEEEAVYNHYYYKDYIITPQLIKEIAGKQEGVVTTFETEDILESKSGNEFESFWTHTYILTGEESESHTYHTTNKR